VAYFDESVQGLEIDSPVKYRGVSIGRVQNIAVAPDGKLIQVTMRIDSKLEPDKNLVAQLKSVGITGIMFVELDQRKKGEPSRTPSLRFPSKYPVITTKPSEIQQLLAGVNDVIAQVRQMNLPEISEKIRLTLDRIDSAVDDARIGAISREIWETVAGFQEIIEDPAWKALLAEGRSMVRSTDRTVSRIDELLQANEAKIASAVSHLNRTLANIETLTGEPSDDPATASRVVEELQRAAEGVAVLIAQSIELVQNTEGDMRRLNRDIRFSVRELDRAIRHLNDTLALIADQPSRLLFSQPPPEKGLKTRKP
jgi:phospholipid/cholesterol/gamma-HCH transport system substrate-binding protein